MKSDQTIKANTPAYRLRMAARRAVRNAIARGDLVKPSCCDQCGKRTRTRARREDLVLILRRHGVGYIPGLLRDLGGYIARAEQRAREDS